MQYWSQQPFVNVVIRLVILAKTKNNQFNIVQPSSANHNNIKCQPPPLTATTFITCGGALLILSMANANSADDEMYSISANSFCASEIWWKHFKLVFTCTLKSKTKQLVKRWNWTHLVQFRLFFFQSCLLLPFLFVFQRFYRVRSVNSTSKEGKTSKTSQWSYFRNFVGK